MSEQVPKPSVYVETTIPSYLTAWPSADLTTAAFQRLTREWWKVRAAYDLFISQAVLDEAAAGDASAAELRMSALRGIEVLATDPDALRLGDEYVDLLALPARAKTDAIHLAHAVVFELDYLLTWNMRHLANSLTIQRVTEHNRARGLWVPLIVTPQYLLELREDEA